MKKLKRSNKCLILICSLFALFACDESASTGNNSDEPLTEYPCYPDSSFCEWNTQSEIIDSGFNKDSSIYEIDSYKFHSNSVNTIGIICIELEIENNTCEVHFCLATPDLRSVDVEDSLKMRLNNLYTIKIPYTRVQDTINNEIVLHLESCDLEIDSTYSYTSIVKQVDLFEDESAVDHGRKVTVDLRLDWLGLEVKTETEILRFMTEKETKFIFD